MSSGGRSPDFDFSSAHLGQIDQTALGVRDERLGGSRTGYQRTRRRHLVVVVVVTSELGYPQLCRQKLN